MTDQVRQQAQDLAERAAARAEQHAARIRALVAEVQRLTAENARLWNTIDMLARHAKEQGALLDRIVRRRAMGEAKPSENQVESA